MSDVTPRIDPLHTPNGGNAMGSAHALSLAASGAWGLDSVAQKRRWVVALSVLWGFLGLVLIGTSAFEDWTGGAKTGAGDLLNQILFVSLFLVMLIGSGRLTLRGLMPLPLGVVLALAFCALSVTWAIDPMVSLRRFAFAAITVWMCFRLTNALGPERVLKTLRWALIILLVINYLVVFFSPFGVHPNSFGDGAEVAGNWRGIIPHKNITGAACAITILLMVFDNRQFSRLFTAIVIAAAAVFLYFSVSKTSQGMLVMGLAAGWLIRGYSPNYRSILMVALLIILAVMIQLLSVNVAAVRDMLNDPTLLTGRTAIWPLLIEYIAQHPFTGAGFGSFWQIGDASPIYRLTSSWVSRYGSHGHNGYLDLAATIGVPGMLLAIVALLVWPLLRLLLSHAINKPRRALLFSLMVFAIGHNMTESTLLNGAAVVQVMLMFTVAIIYFHSDNSDGAHHRMSNWVHRLLGMQR